MSQIFHPSINIITTVALLVVLLLLAGLAWLGYYTVRSPFMTEVGIAKAQAVPYSHAITEGNCILSLTHSNTQTQTN